MRLNGEDGGEATGTRVTKKFGGGGVANLLELILGWSGGMVSECPVGGFVQLGLLGAFGGESDC